MIKVLVVDDSALMRRAISAMLVESGDFTVETARNGEDALAAIPRVEPDVVTLDLNMPVMDGLTCLSAIMQDFPRPVVIVSSLTQRAALVTLEALELGAVDYVLKPGGAVSLNLSEAADELVSKVRRAAGLRARVGGLAARLRRQNEATSAQQAKPRVGRALSVSDQAPVELIVVGSSTGGPALLTSLFAQLPADFPAAVVVAQHMPASFTGALAQRLDRGCSLPVAEITALSKILPGHVYIAQGGNDVVFCRRGGALAAYPAPASSEHPWHPSIDRLLASGLQVVDPAHTIGVLLTGLGDDGAEQMTVLRKRGGRTIAESKESAVVWGMPGELVAKRGASVVLDAAEVVPQLLAWV